MIKKDLEENPELSEDSSLKDSSSGDNLETEKDGEDNLMNSVNIYQPKYKTNLYFS